jgi:iron complex outermembrane receptor protein
LNLAGQRLQNAPKWSASLGASYETALTADVSARLGVNYSYTSEKLLTSIIDVARARVQPQHLLNANIDFKLRDRFTIGVWATNLFDKRYINSVFDAPGTLGLTNYAPPRMFGVSFKAEY